MQMYQEGIDWTRSGMNFTIFSMQCPVFDNYRKQALKKFFWKSPNVYKIDLLYNHSQSPVILRLVRFYKEIFDFLMNKKC